MGSVHESGDQQTPHDDRLHLERIKKLLCNVAALRLVVAFAILGIIFANAAAEGAPGFLTQKTVAGNTSALVSVRSATDPNWYFVDRQGTPTSPASYNFGTVLQSGTYSSGLTYFTFYNYGENAIDVTIRATNMTGATTTWTLNDTATVGSDQYGLKAGLSGGDYTVTVKLTSPYNTLISGLAAAGTQQWGLQLYAPTVMSAFEAMAGNVTLTISLP